MKISTHLLKNIIASTTLTLGIMASAAAANGITTDASTNYSKHSQLEVNFTQIDRQVGQ